MSIALLVLSGASLTAAPALADGANGEVRGFLWPGGNGQPNWEGTYRMPDGQEAWCASVWAPEPKYAENYVDGGVLTMNNGAPMPVTGERSLAHLAYIVSEASSRVIGQSGGDADNYAAAVSVIVHDWTNSNRATYDANWPLDAFRAGVDPTGTGQQPQRVPDIVQQLTTDARAFAGAWTISLDAGEPRVRIGNSVPFTGVLRTATGVPIPNAAVQLVGVGASVPAQAVTDATGAFTFTGTITAADAQVTASRVSPADTVTMKVPTAWKGERPQNMIVVNGNAVSASAPVEGYAINLGTSATDQADGDRVLPWDGGTIVDEVSYENLTPGTEYTVSGELMDQATGDSTGITGETVFTPTSAAGTVSVAFTVPAGHAGTSLVVFERLYDAEGALLATHEDLADEAQTVAVAPQPTVGTSATDQADGDRLLPWDGGTIVDAVAYTGLTPGSEYRVTGELMDRDTGEPTRLTGETVFTPDTADGTVSVTFTVPAGYAATSLVVFERLFNAAGTLQTVHEDIADEAQTVGVAPQPTLGTSATDQSDGDRSLAWDGGTIVDQVAYTGLTPGAEYRVTGELMDQATGEPTGITGETVFTPETADGTVAVTFEVPSGHAGGALVAFEKLFSAAGVLQASHEDLEDEAQTVTVELQPTLGTSATDQSDGDRTLPWDGGTIVDVVSYEHLIPGTEYTVSGELMDQESGDPTGIIGETVFTPDTPDGTVEVVFTVPAGFAGASLVAFERLVNAAGTLQATHEDLEDEAQTVTVAPQPTLRTSATDQADGDRILHWEGGTIIDVVTFTGLTPGVEYTVSGVLMDRATGEPTELTGETVFTPETADGSVWVIFTVPRGYPGRTLVAFERLVNAEGVFQASHEDLEDDAQTVLVRTPPREPHSEPKVPPTTPPPGTPATPGTPGKPGTPGQPHGGAKGGQLSRTGGELSAPLWAAGIGLLITGAAVAALEVMRRRTSASPERTEDSLME